MNLMMMRGDAVVDESRAVADDEKALSSADKIGAATIVQPLQETAVLVPPEDRENFSKRLTALSRKAERFGLPPIEVIDQSEVAYTRRLEYVGRDGDRMLATLVPVAASGVDDRAGRSRKEEGPPIILSRITIRYPIVKLGEWMVVGLIERLEGATKALTFRVGDQEVDGEQLKARAERPLHCEHCNTRRARNSAYLLRDPQGSYKQVGASCLEDFAGIDPGAALWFAKMAALIRLSEGELDDYCSGAGRRSCFYTLRFLADVLFLVDRFGFVSVTKARESMCEPTYVGASDIQPFLDEHPDRRAEYLADMEKNDARAAQIIEWMLAKPEESDFVSNAKLLLSQEVLKREPRHLAIAAATVATFIRERAEHAEARRPSDWVGQVGEKLEQKLQVDRVVEIPNHFSRASRFMLLFKDPDGNIIKWTTTAAPNQLVSGSPTPVLTRFRVSAHEVYNGKQKQTVVTHLKVIA